MKELVELDLENIVLFKKATLPLKHKGVTVVRGYNKDADRKNSEDNTNAAGKSLLLSCIPQVLSSTDALTQNIKSRAKRDFFSNKGSQISLSFRDGKDNYVIKKKAKGKSLEYLLSKNGKDLKARGIAYCEEKIKEWFPYTDDELFTLYFINSARQNTLQMGSPSQRMEFFTQLFRLDNYDEVRKLINSRLNSIRNHDANRLKMIESDLKDYYSEVEGFDYESSKRELEKLLKRQKAINSELEDFYKRSSQLSLIKSNRKVYEAFNKLCAKLGIEVTSASVLRKFIKKQKQELSRLKKLKRQIESYREYLADEKAYRKQKTELSSKVKKIKRELKGFDSKQFKALEKSYIEMKSKLNDFEYEDIDEKKIEKQLGEIEDTLDSLNMKTIGDSNIAKELKKKIKGRQIKVDDWLDKYLDEIKESLAKEKQSLSTNEERLDALRDIKDCKTCPSCSQEVNAKQTKKLIKEFERENKEIASRVRVYADLRTCVEKLSLVLQQLKKAVEASKQKELEAALTKEVKAVKKKLTDLLPKNKLYKKAKDYIQQLKELEKPEKVRKPEVTSIDESEVSDWINKAEILEPVFDALLKSDVDNIETELKNIEKASASLKKKSSKCNDKIPSLSSKIEVYRNTVSKIKKLESERNELSEKLSDVPVLEMLAEAYSNKGLKLLVIRQIASMIEKNMNHFAPLIYKEKIKFTFEVAENQFNIIAERQYKGAKRVSDVRRLSGAESRAFSFLLPLAILPLIPQHRRMNVMVLDEPTVNLDNSTKTLFMRSFIPKLSSVIPHIIIVTPLDDTYPRAREYTVIKENGVSTLVETKKAGRLIS